MSPSRTNTQNQSTASGNVRLIVRNRNIIQTSTPNRGTSNNNSNNNNNNNNNNNQFIRNSNINYTEPGSASTVVTLRTDEGRDMRFRVTLSALDSNRSNHSSQQQQQQQQRRSSRITRRNENDVSRSNDNDDDSRSSEETTAVALLGRIGVRRRVCSHIYKKTFCSKCHIRRRHMCRWLWRQQYRQL